MIQLVKQDKNTISIHMIVKQVTFMPDFDQNVKSMRRRRG